MLFLGNFSFGDLGPDREVRHGYFSCLVDTDDADHAASQFRKHILDQKKKGNLFKNTVSIYLDEIIEIRQNPKEVLLLNHRSAPGEFPESISYSLPGTNTRQIGVYGLAADIEANAREPEDKYTEAEPFIHFE